MTYPRPRPATPRGAPRRQRFRLQALDLLLQQRVHVRKRTGFVHAMQKLEERVTPRGFDSGPIGLSPPVPAANQAVVSLSPPHASPGRPPIPKRRGGSVVLFGTPPGDRDVYRFWGRLGCRPMREAGSPEGRRECYSTNFRTSITTMTITISATMPSPVPNARTAKVSPVMRPSPPCRTPAATRRRERSRYLSVSGSISRAWVW